jgi:transcriptional regulator with XRE-family HTH domain
MAINEIIRAIREEKGITQAFVADSIGMDRANYSRMERSAGNRVYYDYMLKICQALGITIYELLTYNDMKRPELPEISNDDIVRIMNTLLLQKEP